MEIYRLRLDFDFVSNMFPWQLITLPTVRDSMCICFRSWLLKAGAFALVLRKCASDLHTGGCSGSAK